jgi:hypothetical protein
MFAGDHSIDDSDLLRLSLCVPGLAQEATSRTLGYGHLYYGLIRMMQPEHVLVIGSGFGFAPAVMALALAHNGHGHLTFVDPSMDGARDGMNAAHGGQGSWDTPEATRARFACAGVPEGIITHYRETNREFFSRYEQRNLPAIDLALIDGAHDEQNASYDLREVSQRLSLPAFVLMHDATHWLNRTGHMGVARVLGRLRGRVEQVTFPGSAGLAVLRFTQNLGIEVAGLPPPSVVVPALAVFGAGLFAGWILSRWFR